ncbi:MAG TPA: hypothetical protein PL096_12380 [Micropepsaceae bacterium]|nr:hypothetical protein [Micropepsaceae bacterium]
MKNLKTLVLAGACAAALSVPAMADEAASASNVSDVFASLSGGYADIDYDFFGGDDYFVDLAVGAKLWDTNWALQGQLGWEATDYDFGSEVDSFTPGLSVFTRDPSRYAFGAGFVWHGLSSSGSDSDVTTYGAFGEFFANQFTIGGGLHVIDGDAFEGWGGQIDGSWYMCESAALRAKYRWIDIDGAPDTIGVLGASVDYKLEGSALTFSAFYEHIDSAISLDGDVFGGRLSFRFGGSDSEVLMERDRNGTIDTRLEIETRHVF